jgi:hypothetical protein
MTALAEVALTIFGRTHPVDEIKYHVVDNFSGRRYEFLHHPRCQPAIDNLTATIVNHGLGGFETRRLTLAGLSRTSPQPSTDQYTSFIVY